MVRADQQGAEHWEGVIAARIEPVKGVLTGVSQGRCRGDLAGEGIGRHCRLNSPGEQGRSTTS